MIKEGLFTTVVGSFPLDNTKDNMIRAFDDEINMGIDYPCYPQLVSMNAQFLSPLSKLIAPLQEGEAEKFTLSSDFQVPNELVALEYGKFMVDFLEERPYLMDMIKGTKACLTGPFTLASEILLQDEAAKGVEPFIFNEPRGLMVEWVVDKLAEIMKRIGKAYSEMGINIISMDEPILGLMVGRRVSFHTREFIIETLNKALSGIKELSSIHVCGRVSPNLRDILLESDTKILDHEFKTNERNFDIFEKSHFEKTDKYLAMGCLQTNPTPIKDGKVKDYVEDINSLKDYIKKGIDKFGGENLIIKPDCGFGALKNTFGDIAYEIVMRKLNNLVLAVNEFK